MFALIDCNNFYVSAERVFNPKLENSAVVVLSNNDGCAISRSNEAKALNIPMGAPAFQFKELFEQNNVQVYSSNYALYGDMSRRVMNILSTYSPHIEIYSIDEAFLEFKGFELYDLQVIAEEIKSKVRKWTGIPISIGMAKTKALAKVANRVAKKFPDRTGGIYTIDTDEKRIKALKWLKIGDVWGIGPRYSKRLIHNNVRNAYDFTQLSDAWVKNNMAITGLRLKKDLQGIPTLGLEKTKTKQNIATTRSFSNQISSLEELEERVSTYTVSCATKLRAQRSFCQSLVVFIHTNYHRKDLPQYSKSVKIELPYPTHSNITLVRYAKIGLQRIYQAGYQYKKAGVVIMDITPQDGRQLNIFEQENSKHGPAMNAIDRINSRIGRDIVKMAGQDPGRTWKMRQEKLSPRYTTSLKELITIS